jgi:pyruvate dehydrogenase E1 component alpha subunit
VKGHVSVDPAAYRDPAELAAALKTDPIAAARAQCLEAGIAAARLDAIDEAAHAEVEAALAAADAAPWPDAADAFTDVQTTGAGQWT